MSEELELAPQHKDAQQSLTRQEAQPVANADPVLGMLQKVIQDGVTKENVEALGKLADLYERMAAKNAEREFAQAFTALQNELPAVQAMRAVPNKDGSLRYKYAPYEDVMKQVQPMLTKHGFSVRFSSKVDEKRITMFCTLMHTAGHSITNEFTVRVGEGPPGSSQSQADGAASSYAQRGALCDCLNIVIRKDDDARIEGAKITTEQAAQLRERVKATGSNEGAFLRFAQASSYEEIAAAKWPMLDANLKRKERP